MGLDAFVNCNCFRDGKTTEPPFPRDWLHVDADGYLSLKPGHETSENWGRLYDWRQTCCEHPRMEVASAGWNWGGYRAFQEAFGKVGWKHFPVLHAELPEGNGGHMMPASARKALDELAYFGSRETLGENSFLVDSTTGKELWNHVAGYQGIFIWAATSAGVEVGFDERGLFVRDGQSHEVLFRSMRFTQTLNGPKRGYDQPVVLRDAASGTKFLLSFAIHGEKVAWPDGRMKDDQGQVNFSIPAGLHVEVRAITPKEFDYILGPLERVFRASVETGNPVVWC